MREVDKKTSALILSGSIVNFFAATKAVCVWS